VKINFAAWTLARWDRPAGGELLAGGFYTQNCARYAAAGWSTGRFDGRISKLTWAGTMTGAEGRKLLMPPAAGMPWLWNV